MLAKYFMGKGVAGKVKSVADAVYKMADVLRVREKQIQYMQLNDYNALKQFVYDSVMQDKSPVFRQYAREIIKKALKLVNIPVLREKFDQLHKKHNSRKNQIKRKRRKNREREDREKAIARANEFIHPVWRGTNV